MIGPEAHAEEALPPHDESIVQAMLRWHTRSPPPAIEHVVDATEDGLRITRIAGKQFPLLGSKSQAELAVKRGQLLLNSEVPAKSRIVHEGDVLSLSPPASSIPSRKQLALRARFISHLYENGLRAVYEDDDLAVVYKPAGVHTKSKSNLKYAALEDALAALLEPPSREEESTSRDDTHRAPVSDALPLPLVMHRLDVPVAGLCVVAKTRSAALHLSREFAEREVTKEYHALLVGSPRLGVPLGTKATITTPVDGLPSETQIEVREVVDHVQWGQLSYVAMWPHTGRTHQLRVHAAATLGCPIVGDDLYWQVSLGCGSRWRTMRLQPFFDRSTCTTPHALTPWPHALPFLTLWAAILPCRPRKRRASGAK
jgi:23S rRNA pseudouridine1911/1915/1917 synthase